MSENDSDWAVELVRWVNKMAVSSMPKPKKEAA